MIDLANSEARHLALLHRQMIKLLDQELAPLDLGHGRYLYLFSLYLRGDRRQQELADLAIVGGHPVLEELVGAGAHRVEPDAGPGGLAELGAVGGGEQRPRERPGGPAVHPPDQVHPAVRPDRQAERRRDGGASPRAVISSPACTASPSGAD